jgi:osmoprotectant transport system permease protein
MAAWPLSFIGDAASWLADADSWDGTSGIANRLVEHARYSAVAVTAAFALAAPPAAWLGHKRRFGTVGMNIANIGQTLPTFAVLVLVVQLVGIGDAPVVGPLALFLALVLLAIPPVFTNVYTGFAAVDDAYRDAARGLGMTEQQQLLRTELPLALPLVVTGLRIAVVQVIATATIGAYAGTGGLGRFIIDGFALQDYPQVFGGALLVAVVAIVCDRALVLIEGRLRVGRRSARRLGFRRSG